MFMTSDVLMKVICLLIIMVTSCCVVGCTNRREKGCTLSFHRFPMKNSELLQKWIKAVSRQNWYPNEDTFVCSVHFTDDCYNVTAQRSRLKKDAFPSIFPKEYPSYMQNQKKEKQKSPKKRKLVDVQPRKAVPSPSKLRRTVQLDHPYGTKEQVIDNQVSKLKRKVDSMRKKVKRRDKKIQNMVDLLKHLKKKQLIADYEHILITENFGSIAEELFQNQSLNSRKLTTFAHRYSDITKQIAMTLHYYSPKAYEFVRKILKLPHSSSIKHWATSVDCEPGYLTNVIQVIGQLAKKKVWMKDVVLVVDAMSIHKMTIYDKNRKSFVGLVDYGTAVPEADATEATEALVFMIVGLTGN